MSDTALDVLTAALLRERRPALWIADEQAGRAGAALGARPALTAITNRCDIAGQLRAQGLTVQLNDFELAAAAPVQVVALRVAKEKALVHHVINAALEALPVGGELWLAGGRQEGIKTYLDKAAHRAGTTAVVERHGSVLFGRVGRTATLAEPLDDQHYSELRTVDLGQDLQVWSKPGIYGWQKVDTGSALLAQALPEVWPQPPAQVLDIGCGYGYLSLCAARLWPQAQIAATDNNVAAVAACRRNLEAFGARCAVTLDDCAAGIGERFDAVLCNPPFHQGFAVEGDLTAQFLASARRHLRRGGRALFVVNQFIPVERKAAPLFAGVRELRRERGFKLLVLEP